MTLDEIKNGLENGKELIHISSGVKITEIDYSKSNDISSRVRPENKNTFVIIFNNKMELIEQ